jgi:hypothetical protein
LKPGDSFTSALGQSEALNQDGSGQLSPGIAVEVEADGDLHFALTDATGDKPIICEVPCKPAWCGIRTTCFQLDTDEISPAYSIHEKTHDQRNASHHRDWKSVLGHRSRAQRWIKSKKATAGLRCLGDSPGDETKTFVTARQRH